MTCPDCSAPDKANATRFHEFFVKEFKDSSYGTVHRSSKTKENDLIAATSTPQAKLT